MTAFGSLQNLMMGNARNPDPRPGDGATRLSWTDRHPYTVSRVSASGRTLWAREDRATANHRGLTDCQDWSITPNPDAREERFSLRQDGTWREVGSRNGARLLIGHRDRYEDPSF